jgi:hypothetical protein
MGALKREMTEPQTRFFKKLLVLKMVKVQPTVAAVTPPSASVSTQLPASAAARGEAALTAAE